MRGWGWWWWEQREGGGAVWAARRKEPGARARAAHPRRPGKGEPRGYERLQPRFNLRRRRDHHYHHHCFCCCCCCGCGCCLCFCYCFCCYCCYFYHYFHIFIIIIIVVVIIIIIIIITSFHLTLKGGLAAASRAPVRTQGRGGASSEPFHGLLEALHRPALRRRRPPPPPHFARSKPKRARMNTRRRADRSFRTAPGRFGSVQAASAGPAGSSAVRPCRRRRGAESTAGRAPAGAPG